MSGVGRVGSGRINKREKTHDSTITNRSTCSASSLILISRRSSSVD